MFCEQYNRLLNAKFYWCSRFLTRIQNENIIYNVALFIFEIAEIFQETGKVFYF